MAQIKHRYPDMILLRSVASDSESLKTPHAKRRVTVSKIIRLVRHRFYGRWLARRDKQISRILGSPALCGSSDNYREIPGTRINDPETLEWVRRISPDVIVTCGAPLLRASWFDLAPYGAINLHYGISSAYRGEHTLFYPLLFGECDAIGVTLHRIDKSIDAGPIFAMCYPQLSGHESEAEIFASCAEIGARMLLGLLDRMEVRDVQPTILPLKSRLIKYSDRRMIDDLRLVFSRTRLPSRLERIEWLC